ncbi:uncharacterized protein Dana_GF21920 [Drosophila ananassae]|uniref:Nudix hydrolase domain-containing protein n=1 Tax=Drosophila ananassae TaxID=7217 RepID=B3MZ15_DROAN|nr:nudix hydrolase 8 [Drosophila ananassae]XP_044573147.1 nudix hydrolase 8 [Drosophila ananassae]EDV32859.1 uncharacterized protein Dana_GF21920 [Drosophila ananassae]
MLATSFLGRRNCLNLSTLTLWRTLTRTTRPRSPTAALRIPANHPYPAPQLQEPIVRNYSKTNNMESPPGVFRGIVDRFAGVTVDGREEHVESSGFREKLNKSLDFWRTNKNRAIWFRVYKEQADWVPILAENGFDFHHARTGVVVMFQWLPKDESSNLPNYAHTLMGVGGLVINDKDEVLVVTDRFAMIPNSWKLPGGYVEPRENFVDAAIREVAEETGIQSEFKSLVSLRHSHYGNFGCSDVYIVVALKPLNLDFKRCEREIARVQWMPIEEYLNHPQVHETNRQFLCTYLDYKKRDLTITVRDEVHQVLKKKYNLYFVEREQSKSS